MDIEKLKDEALQLDPEVRAYLARELLASLDTMSEDEIERLWLDEALHRDDELDKGIAKAYPAQEVFRRVRSRLGKFRGQYGGSSGDSMRNSFFLQ